MIKINDLELLKNIDILFENEMILYGAGDYGRRACKLLNEMKLPILGVCDSNAAKWGEEIEGNKVMSFCEMMSLFKEKRHVILIFAIASPGSVKQVLRILERYGMPEIECYTYFALRNTVELHMDDNRIEESFREKEKAKAMLYRDFRANRKEHIALSVLRNAITERETFLVLQPGKVGSSSVCESLRREGIPCYHLHELTGKWGWGKPFEKAQKGIWALHEAEKIKMISLAREPVARGISLYFQRIQEHIGRDAYFVEQDTYKGVLALLKEEAGIGNYGHMFEWFNMELRDIFGIDVYQNNFDREKGYQLIQQGNVELLLLKMEKLNDCQEMIGRFAGIDNFKLMKSNTGNDKLYHFAYEELKRTIDIPRDILDFYYKDNPAMDHFYTSKEKEGFYRKWLR